ncbi:uncharacterized protein [Antedon mediterranea]|uniref:uncharacterized protein n=1 Tax=Antedon mediterranea TaxID=105859 RepID=UPI003AF5DA64
MEGWSGFTDEQLQRLKGQDDCNTQKPTQRRKDPRRNPATNRNRARETSHQRQQATNEDSSPPLDINQMLSVPSERKTKPNNHKQRQRNSELQTGNEAPVTKEKVKGQEKSSVDKESGKKDKEEVKDEVENKEDEVKTVEVNEIDEAEGKSRELTQLEQIQKKQMEMEEENRKKKLALTKAINERKKRTQAETKQLAFIQRELGKLESLLSADVKILREKIETSSFEYNAARKRYEKAENEFVAAKLHLHKVTEHKEALTEHLYTIIQENENRKANKLAELMEKLNVENMNEFIDEAEKEMERQQNSQSKEIERQPISQSKEMEHQPTSQSKEIDSHPISPTLKTALSLSNGQQSSIKIDDNLGNVTLNSEPSSKDGVENLVVSPNISQFNSNPHGLETIAEVDSESPIGVDGATTNVNELKAHDQENIQSVEA